MSTVTIERHSAHTAVWIDGKPIGWVSPTVVYPGRWYWTTYAPVVQGNCATEQEAIDALVKAYEAQQEEQ